VKYRQHNGQQLEDPKGVIRSRKAKDRQHNGQQLEDTKGVIRSRKAKSRQHNGQQLEDTKGVSSWRGVLDTTLCDDVCQCLATGWWFSPGTPDSPINKTDHHNIAKLLL
jgi:hypothetical protein